MSQLPNIFHLKREDMRNKTYGETMKLQLLYAGVILNFPQNHSQGTYFNRRQIGFEVVIIPLFAGSKVI